MPAILEQMMKPAEKIESIRIHHVSGLNGAPGTAGAGGAGGDAGNRPPINQVLDSILGMAVQLPALKSIGDSIGYDFSAALPKASDGDPGGRDRK
jgi:hypothetical protein